MSDVKPDNMKIFETDLNRSFEILDFLESDFKHKEKLQERCKSVFSISRASEDNNNTEGDKNQVNWTDCLIIFLASYLFKFFSLHRIPFTKNTSYSDSRK